MDVSPLFRSRARAAVTAVGVVALTAALGSCSATEKLTTGLTVKRSVEKLGEQPAATMLVHTSASRERAEAFLRAAGVAGSGESLQEQAQLLSGGEATFAVGSDQEKTPLKDLPKSERLNLAAAVNFGGKDTFAAKSVDEQLYVRVNLRSVAHHFKPAQLDKGRAERLVALADRLPATLGSAKDALRGRWVRVDPEAFDQFAAAAQQMRESGRQPTDTPTDGSAGSSGDGAPDSASSRLPEQQDGQRNGADGEGTATGAGGAGDDATQPTSPTPTGEFARATALGSALAGQSEREFLQGLQHTLTEHAKFTKAGERAGAEHVTASLPGRAAARDLAQALKALGITLDPRRIPDERITADLEIRRGQLTGMTLDAGQFLPVQSADSTAPGADATGGDDESGGGKGEGAAQRPSLPLEFDFGSGDAIPTVAPNGTRELHPQDLLAAVVYGALGTGRL